MLKETDELQDLYDESPAMIADILQFCYLRATKRNNGQTKRHKHNLDHTYFRAAPCGCDIGLQIFGDKR